MSMPVSFWDIIKFIINTNMAIVKSIRIFFKKDKSNILLSLNILIPTEEN